MLYLDESTGFGRAICNSQGIPEDSSLEIRIFCLETDVGLALLLKVGQA
jgi:hypothetical protein